MKNRVYILPILLLVSLLSFGQLKEEERYNIYKTDQYDTYLNSFNQQDYLVKRKLSDQNVSAKWKDDQGFPKGFFNTVLSSENFNKLRENRGPKNRFSIRYIIDETGDMVLACALYFPKGTITLSTKEIQAILLEAMSHKFEYLKKPKDLNKFYFRPNYLIAI